VLHLLSVVTQVDLCTLNTVAVINVQNNPLQVGVTPDGKFAIVASYNNAISFINTSTNTVSKVIQTDSDTFPAGISISPDGSFALVTTYPFSNTVQIVDVMTGNVNSSVQVPEPIDVIFNSTGMVAYISSRTPGSVVVVVDTKTYAKIANIPTAPGSSDLLLRRMVGS
jgi:DNA-binding beta-propeller fold protein YncE